MAARTKTIAATLTTLLVAAVTLAPSTQAGASGQDEGFKLEGAWIARVTNPFMTPTPQWTYVLSRDPSGRRATVHGAVDVGLGLPGRPTALLGEAVQTGPYTALVSTVWFHLDDAGNVLAICTAVSTVTFIGPGKSDVVHHFAIYSPDADGDGDGLPDPDTSVAPSEFTIITADTRVPSPMR